jgi:hypothetical protein
MFLLFHDNFGERRRATMHLIGNVSVIEREGEFFVTSLQVAEHFGREHYNVMRDIKNLDCSEKFNTLN